MLEVGPVAATASLPVQPPDADSHHQPNVVGVDLDD